jgi:hypothetical protein
MIACHTTQSNLADLSRLNVKISTFVQKTYEALKAQQILLIKTKIVESR